MRRMPTVLPKLIRTAELTGDLEVWVFHPSDLQARRDPGTGVWRLTPAHCPHGSASSSRVFKSDTD
ncbi:hypothetical protein E2C01_050596 [Portunus trituberculatus]|uniref:Uncharacterized protein n=1 Tax=Portunus trituberculatus TaxID=210409 RepID=A0A5B7G9F4_PORTR|nr:hypothetical protein [Portunus trituberculatus]